jgi:hypothetical protein
MAKDSGFAFGLAAKTVLGSAHFHRKCMWNLEIRTNNFNNLENLTELALTEGIDNSPRLTVRTWDNIALSNNEITMFIVERIAKGNTRVRENTSSGGRHPPCFSGFNFESSTSLFVMK